MSEDQRGSSPVCRRFFVSGRVQGVGFRYATAEKARQLGISGYAKNLANGRVEVFASGDRVALDGLGEWLNEGPSAARVRQVSVEAVADAEASADFCIL